VERACAPRCRCKVRGATLPGAVCVRACDAGGHRPMHTLRADVCGPCVFVLCVRFCIFPCCALAADVRCGATVPGFATATTQATVQSGLCTAGPWWRREIAVESMPPSPRLWLPSRGAGRAHFVSHSFPGPGGQPFRPPAYSPGFCFFSMLIAQQVRCPLPPTNKTPSIVENVSDFVVFPTVYQL